MMHFVRVLAEGPCQAACVLVRSAQSSPVDDNIQCFRRGSNHFGESEYMWALAEQVAVASIVSRTRLPKQQLDIRNHPEMEIMCNMLSTCWQVECDLHQNKSGVL